MDIYATLKKDHRKVGALMEKVLSARSPEWREELFGEFKQAVEHHVKDEEDRIFPHAQHILSDEQAEDLGEKMQRLEKEAMKEAA